MNQKLKLKLEIRNEIIYKQQQGNSNTNTQKIQQGTSGSLIGQNGSFSNFQNFNQSGLTFQQNNTGFCSQDQKAISLNSANLNVYGDLIDNFNQQQNGNINFKYQSYDKGEVGLSGSLYNNQQQESQFGLKETNFCNNHTTQKVSSKDLNKSENIITNNDFNKTKDLLSDQLKNILSPLKNQNVLLESSQNCLMSINTGIGIYDSAQLIQSWDQTQNQKFMFEKMMNSSGSQLTNSYNFPTTLQNQLISSQNNQNNEFNPFIRSQNFPQPPIQGSNFQQFKNFQYLQQQNQLQQQLRLPDSIQQPNLLQLQQYRTINSLQNSVNLNSLINIKSQDQQLAKDILDDISDVNSDVEPIQKEIELIDEQTNIQPNKTLMQQIKDFYRENKNISVNQQKIKDRILSSIHEENIKILIQNRQKKIQQDLEQYFINCKKYIEAISSIQSFSSFSNSQINETSAFQQNNNIYPQNNTIPNQNIFQSQLNIIEIWEQINDCIQKNMEQVVQILKISLEDTIWNINMSYHQKQINEKKKNLSQFAENKVFGERYEFTQSNKEIERFLDVLLQNKYLLNEDDLNYENQLKNILNQSSNFNFIIEEDPINKSIYCGYIHKVNKLKFGRGILITNDSCIYQGYFENDKPSGQGRIIYPSLNIYDGNFEEGLQHGQGKYLWNNGNQFEGNFEKGRRSGRGKFIWKDGRTYEGYYKNDAANGFGEYNNIKYQPIQNQQNANCYEIYRGNWKNNRMEGQGILFVGMQAEWKENHLININQQIVS